MKKISTQVFLLLFCALGMNAQVLLSEDFESGIPSDWTNISAATDGGWLTGAPGTLSSQFFPIPDNGSTIAASNDDDCNCDKISDRLTLPRLDFTGYDALVLRFDAYYLDNFYGAQEDLTVEVSLDNENWTVVEDLPGANEWTSYGIYLSEYANEDSVYVSFHYSDGGGWLYGVGIDNVTVNVVSPRDVKMVSVDVTRFNELDTDVEITGVISNLGSSVLESVDISWTDGTNTYTDNVTGLSVESDGTYAFTHTSAFTVSDAISYDLEVWADNPNGGDDGDESNNMGASVVSGVTFIPTKRVVGEEGTGTWCGWCPRGFVALEEMREAYPETFIGIAVHNGDPMAFAEYDNGVGFTAYPSSHVDRIIMNSDPGDFEQDYLSLINNIAPIDVNVNATFGEGSRDVTIEVSAEFVTQLSDIDYRFNVVMVEDSVVGSGSGYAQENYYSFAVNNLPLSGSIDWQAAPGTVPASEMVYNEVGRALLAGYEGEPESLPAAVVAGDVASYTFEYTVPNSYDMGQLRAVALVIDNASGAILNANQTTLEQVVGAKEVFQDNLAKVFPNPFSDVLNIQLNLDEAAEVQVELYNAMGQLVTSRYYGQRSGEMTLTLDGGNLASGVYSLKLRAGERFTTKRVVLEK